MQPDPNEAIVKHISEDVEFAHGHSPKFGGTLAWNDIQQIAQMNGMIRSMNRRRAQLIMKPSQYTAYLQNEEDENFPGKLPYIHSLDENGYPSQGYNMHGHKNDFDGGYLAGAGNHDHRGAGYGGFSFAVYHPATTIPLRSYVVED